MTMAGDIGKELYESLEVLFNFVEDGMAEAAFDRVVNALVETGAIAKSHDGTGRSFQQWTAARSFRSTYRKADHG